MGSNYQRTSYDRPGAAYGTRQVVNQEPSGLLASNPNVSSAPVAPAVQIDWQGMQQGLPRQSGITDAVNVINGTTQPQSNTFGGTYGGGNGNGPTFGGGSPSEVSNVIGWGGFNQDAATKALAMGVAPAAIAGLLTGFTSTPTLSAEAVARENAVRDRLAAQEAMAQAQASANSSAANGNNGYGGWGNGGNYGGSGGGSQSSGGGNSNRGESGASSSRGF
jgi:hypothetical protein